MESAKAGSAYDLVLTCNYSPWSRYSGGAQKSTHMVACAMSRRGLRVAVVYSKAPWEKVKVPVELPYAVHWAGFFAVRPGISSPLRFLNGIFFLRVLRRICGPETIIHGNGDEAALHAWVASRKGFHYTSRYPNYPAFLRGRDWNRLGTWLRIFFREPRFVAMALGMRHADCVSVTSAISKIEACDSFGLNPAKVHVVHNGIDPVFMEVATPALSHGRGILFYGRLTLAKGADLALDAYAQLPESLRREHALRIMGRGPLTETLQAKAKALGLDTVRFEGWGSSETVLAAMREVKVVLLPSREESFGNTVAETLALGQTLVTTNAGSIPEIAGAHGHRVEGFSVSELAQTLEAALLAQRSEAEVEAQRQEMRQRFSWDAAAAGFRKLYALAMSSTK